MNIKTKISDHNAVIATLNFNKSNLIKSEKNEVNDVNKSQNS